jgi:hypothetical protein
VKPLILFYNQIWGGLSPLLSASTYFRLLSQCLRDNPSHSLRTAALAADMTLYKLGIRSDLWLRARTVAAIVADQARCTITTDHELLDAADAVIFHVPTLGNIDGLRKRPGQVWVAWSRECESHFPRMMDRALLSRIDLTMYYSFDSDIPAPYFRPGSIESFRRPPPDKTAAAPAALFLSSPSDHSGRHEYLRELMQWLPVDSYGKLFRNKALPSDSGRTTKQKALARYKFTLAFENACYRDYVTEKFFQPLRAGSVPVYFGAPNIDAFAPGDNCFIDVRAFAGPRELADHLLALDRDDDAYARFFDWKRKPYRAEFLAKLETQRRHPIARLCDRLNADDE